MSVQTNRTLSAPDDLLCKFAIRVDSQKYAGQTKILILTISYIQVVGATGKKVGTLKGQVPFFNYANDIDCLPLVDVYGSDLKYPTETVLIVAINNGVFPDSCRQNPDGTVDLIEFTWDRTTQESAAVGVSVYTKVTYTLDDTTVINWGPVANVSPKPFLQINKSSPYAWNEVKATLSDFAIDTTYSGYIVYVPSSLKATSGQMSDRVLFTDGQNITMELSNGIDCDFAARGNQGRLVFAVNRGKIDSKGYSYKFTGITYDWLFGSMELKKLTNDFDENISVDYRYTLGWVDSGL
jgi:hypothetical protein